MTLTKKMSEDLTDFLAKENIRVTYLHSDIETVERMEILNSLRSDQIDVIVGINLLREGIDLPEVSLLMILDADKEGFLRSERSLIQIIGRCARRSLRLLCAGTLRLFRSDRLRFRVCGFRHGFHDECSIRDQQEKSHPAGI